MRWLDVITNSMSMSLSKCQELVRTGKPGVLQSMGSQRVRLNWIVLPTVYLSICTNEYDLKLPNIFIGRTVGETEALIFCPPDVKSWLTRKDPDAEKHWGQEERKVTEGELVGWHHWHNGHVFEQTLGDSEEKGSLVCYSSYSHK